MEVEVLDLSQKPICLNETDLPIAMDLSQKVHSQGSGVICLSEDEDDESINQLLNKLNIENPSSKTIEACQLLLHQLDERLRNEETIEILLAQMKHTQKKIPPPTIGTSTNAIRQNGHATQPTSNGANNATSQSVARPNTEVGTENSPSNHTDAAATGSNRTSAHSALNSGAAMAFTSSDSTKSAACSSGPRMTREMAMQALDQQYLARKALLRKQADKALSEVPLARPPQGPMAQSDLNLIPSTATNEFVALVGLEEVVKNLQEYRNLALGHSTNEVRMVFTPFNCVQCGTDFTPLWKRERPGSSKVVCESCCGENYRRALQNDYQDKIRLVLKKYQDQERDLDRDYKDMLDSPKKFELFRKEQEKKLLAMSSTSTRPSATATAQPGSRTSTTGHHHQTPVSTVTATPPQGRPTHRPSNTVAAVSSGTGRAAPTTGNTQQYSQQQQQQQQQMRHQNTTTSGISASSTPTSQLTVDQLAYMQMFQALNQLGSSSTLNQQATRQQQQLMQQILQMAYMSSASTLLGGSTNSAAANSFVQFLSNMAGLLNNPTSTPDTTGAAGNSTASNALLNYYLSMLQQQQQAAANSDK